MEGFHEFNVRTWWNESHLKEKPNKNPKDRKMTLNIKQTYSKRTERGTEDDQETHKYSVTKISLTTHPNGITERDPVKDKIKKGNLPVMKEERNI